MKKILMITTGGTIASRHTDAGLTPMISAAQMLEYVPEILEFCVPDTLPKHWQQMVAAIKERYDQ